MTRPIMSTDSKPWFRQFWPWFLMALPASVVVAGLTTVYIANRHADDLVADEYYKEGLAINRQLAKQEAARALALTADLNVSIDQITVRLTGPVTDPVLRLRLSHPIEADRDFYLSLARRADGLYSGPLPVSVGAHWHWTLDSGEDSSWRLDGSLSPRDIDSASES